MRILYAEDSVNTGKAMKVLLEMKGHTVDHVTTVADAVARLDGAAYDLLISDLTLPDGTGDEILSRSPRQIPAIALSGYTSQNDRTTALGKGFRDYLTKPFKTEDLLAAIQRIAS